MRYLLTFILAFGLIVFGGHAGRRALLLSKKPEVAAAAAWYDIWIDMENGSQNDQVDRFMLTNMTVVGSAACSHLVYSNNATIGSNRFMRVSTLQKVSGTRSLSYDNTQDQGWCEATLLGNFTNACGGYALRLGPGFAGLTFGSYDFADAKAPGSEYIVAPNYNDEQGNEEFGVHTGAGLGPTMINDVQTNTWYWIAWQWSKLNTTATMVVNTMNPTTPIWTSSITLASENINRFRFMRIDNHDVFNAGATNFVDDVCIDTNGSSWAWPSGTTPP